MHFSLADGCIRRREVARDDDATELYAETRPLKSESPPTSLASSRSRKWTPNDQRRYALPEPSAPPEEDARSGSFISEHEEKTAS